MAAVRHGLGSRWWSAAVRSVRVAGSFLASLSLFSQQYNRIGNGQLTGLV